VQPNSGWVRIVLSIKKGGNILTFLFGLAGSAGFNCAADRTLPVATFMIFLQEAKFLEDPIRIVIFALPDSWYNL